MQVTYVGRAYVASVQPNEEDKVKNAGFQQDPTTKQWHTYSLSTVTPFEPYMDSVAWNQFQADQARARIMQQLSAQTNTTRQFVLSPTVQALGEDYMPCQKAYIVYATNQQNVLNADDPGVGKTIETAGTINELQEMFGLQKVLVICPGRLKFNWHDELDKWLVKKYGIHVVTGSDKPNFDAIQIINYQLLHKWEYEIKTRPWDLVVIDEAHKIKRPSALRSKLILGSKKKNVVSIAPLQAERIHCLSGTPMPNGRPRELWPLVHYLDPVNFHDFRSYALEFCNASISKKTKKLTFPPGEKAASNLDKLQDKLRATIMIRREKKDVLKDLPPKRRQVIELPEDGCEEVILEELRAFDTYKVELERLKKLVETTKVSGNTEEYKSAVRLLRAGMTYAFSQMAKMRLKTALAKMPMMLAHIDALLDEGATKLAVYAHHHQVHNAFKEHFKDKAVMLTGQVSNKVFYENVKTFQNDPNCQIAICAITLAEGYTITAAEIEVFAEGDWVPGPLTQAEDRVHRKGQTKNLLIQHLVLRGSLDATMIKRVVAKQNNNDKALNVPEEEQEMEAAYA